VGNGSNWCRVRHDTSNVVVSAGAGNANWDWQVGQATSWVRPRVDNTWDCGDGSYRWRNTYSVNYGGDSASLNNSVAVSGMRLDPIGSPYLFISGGGSVASGSTGPVNWTSVTQTRNYIGIIGVAGTQMQNSTGYQLLVRIDYSLAWPASSSGTRTAYLRRNDGASFAIQRATTVGSGVGQTQTGSSAILLDSYGYCELMISQDSGSTQTLDWANFVMTLA
jgi:hypothetical protein